MVRVSQNWNVVVICADNKQRVDITNKYMPQWPVTFDSAEAQEVLIEQEYVDIDTQLSRIRDAIGVGVDDWTLKETFDDAVASAKEFKRWQLLQPRITNIIKRRSRNIASYDFDEAGTRACLAWVLG